MDQPTTDQMPSQPMLGQEDMLELVRRQQAGNVSIRAFCEHHHIAQSKFYYWRRKYSRQKEQENDTGFALLQPQHSIGAGRPYCEIITSAGTCIRFYQPVPPSILQSLM